MWIIIFQSLKDWDFSYKKYLQNSLVYLVLQNFQADFGNFPEQLQAATKNWVVYTKSCCQTETNCKKSFWMHICNQITEIILSGNLIARLSSKFTKSTKLWKTLNVRKMQKITMNAKNVPIKCHVYKKIAQNFSGLAPQFFCANFCFWSLCDF